MLKGQCNNVVCMKEMVNVEMAAVLFYCWFIVIFERSILLISVRVGLVVGLMSLCR